MWTASNSRSAVSFPLSPWTIALLMLIPAVVALAQTSRTERQPDTGTPSVLLTLA